MRTSTNERMREVKDKYNSVPAYRYAFSIRGQEYKFETHDQYQEAFGRALDIAKEQEKRFEDQQDVEEALEDSGREKQYELDFETGHDRGDECTCSGCTETERSVEAK